MMTYLSITMSSLLNFFQNDLVLTSKYRTFYSVDIYMNIYQFKYIGIYTFFHLFHISKFLYFITKKSEIGRCFSGNSNNFKLHQAEVFCIFIVSLIPCLLALLSWNLPYSLVLCLSLSGGKFRRILSVLSYSQSSW